MTVMKCTKCGKECLTHFSKQLIDGAYKSLIRKNIHSETFIPNNTEKKFQYCVDQEYTYDYKDYYNIPGLVMEEDKKEEGYHTPVYFGGGLLESLMGMPDVKVNLYSEKYGCISTEKEEKGWSVPFGYNSNGKLVMWLGDIHQMDGQSKSKLKEFNVESDHVFMDSEFYQAQVNHVKIEMAVEKQILKNRKQFIKNIQDKYAIEIASGDDISSEDELKGCEEKIERPATFSETDIAVVINALDTLLSEGFDKDKLRELYEKLYSEEDRKAKYENWKPVQFIGAVLSQLSASGEKVDTNKLLSPLRTLHNYKICLEHSLPEVKQEKKMETVLKALKVADASNLEEIYTKEMEGLNKLLQYLVVLTK